MGWGAVTLPLDPGLSDLGVKPEGRRDGIRVVAQWLSTPCHLLTLSPC